MIFISALCFVLVLSSTSASTESKAKAEELSNKIESAVVSELVQVAKAAEGTNITTLELNKKLLDKARTVFKRMTPELKELRAQSGDSAVRVAKDLAHNIVQNKTLKNALARVQKIAPRGFIFPLAIGLVGVALQIVIHT